MPSQAPPTQKCDHARGQASNEKLRGKAINPLRVISGNCRNELAMTTNSGNR